MQTHLDATIPAHSDRGSSHMMAQVVVRVDESPGQICEHRILAVRPAPPSCLQLTIPSACKQLHVIPASAADSHLARTNP